MPCTKAERVEIVRAMALERPLGEVHVILRRILEYDLCYTSEPDFRDRLFAGWIKFIEGNNNSDTSMSGKRSRLSKLLGSIMEDAEELSNREMSRLLSVEEADVRAANELIERYSDLYDFTPRESVAL